MSFPKSLYQRINIRTKLSFSAILIMLAVSLTLTNIFSSFLSQLIMEDQVKSDMFSYGKAKERFLQIHSDLENHINTLNRSESLSHILTRDYDPAETEPLKDYIDELNLISSELYINNDSLYSVFFVGKNGLVYHYKQYVDGAYLGRTENSSLSREQILSWGTEKDNLFLPQNISRDYEGENNSRENLSSQSPVERIYENLEGKTYLIRELDAKGDDSSMGLVILVYNMDFLTSYFPGPGHSQVFLLSIEGGIIWANKSTEVHDLFALRKEGMNYYEGEEHGQDYLITESSLEPFHYQFIGIRDKDEVLKNIGGTNSSVIMALAAAVLYILIISHYASRQISQPFEQLYQRMAQISSPENHPQISDNKGRLVNRLIRFFVLSTLLPGLFFLFFSFQTYQGLYKKELIEFSAESLEVKKNILDYDINSYRLKLMGTLFNDTFQDLLYSLDNQDRDHEKLDKLSSLLEKRYSLHREPVNLSYFTKEGKRFFTTEPAGHDSILTENNQLYNEINLSSGELIFLGFTQNYFGNSQITFARKINYINSATYPRVGFVKIDIPMNYIKDSLEGEIQPWYDYLVLEDPWGQGKIINALAVTERQATLENLFHGKESYHITTTHSDEYPITYYSLISKNSINKTLSPVRWYAALVIILMLMIIIAASFLLTLSIIIPFRRLVLSLEGGIKSRSHYFKTLVSGYDEIALLSRQFNNMVDEMNRLIQENYESSLKQQELLYLQKEAQFNALQQQINPHFLYNTLDSINWMAYKAGARDVCRMVSALAKLFRGVVNDEQEISLAREREYLEQYIFIQEKRFHQKITFSLDFDHALDDFATVKLILQPLVENSLTHGLESMEKPGHVTIKGRLLDNQVVIEIIDNGKGIPLERLRHINQVCDSGQGLDCLGLRNVIERLRIHFGQESTLSLASNPGIETHITLKFPARLRRAGEISDKE